MKRAFSFCFVLLPLAALILPPFFLLPVIYHLPRAQMFKDFYEACLWLSPAIGVLMLVRLFYIYRKGAVSFLHPMVLLVLFLACLDLVSPLFFYLILAVFAGH